MTKDAGIFDERDNVEGNAAHNPDHQCTCLPARLWRVPNHSVQGVDQTKKEGQQQSQSSRDCFLRNEVTYLKILGLNIRLSPEIFDY